jgi:5-bromo-4-chloroindolyl phosphate hydrolysis protein
MAKEKTIRLTKEEIALLSNNIDSALEEIMRINNLIRQSANGELTFADIDKTLEHIHHSIYEVGKDTVVEIWHNHNK